MYVSTYNDAASEKLPAKVNLLLPIAKSEPVRIVSLVQTPPVLGNPIGEIMEPLITSDHGCDAGHGDAAVVLCRALKISDLGVLVRKPDLHLLQLLVLAAELRVGPVDIA